MLLKIKNEPNYVKDSETGAILSVDSQGVTAYKKQRELRMNQERRINNLEIEISELKNMVLSLVSKK